MINFPGDSVGGYVIGNNQVQLVAREDEGLYSLLSISSSLPTVPGTVFVSEADPVDVYDIGAESDHVRILIHLERGTLKEPKITASEVRGYVRRGQKWVKDQVQAIPVREQLFSRFGSLLETDKVANKRILVIGLGSGESPVVHYLVQSGVMLFDLMDQDRLEVANIMRHLLTLADIGRYKTKAMRDFILSKNPYAKVRTWEERAGEDNLDQLRRLIQEADIVLCGTDNRPSKLIINRLCVQEQTTCIFATAFTRAYGGQVIRVRPFKSLCYQCFLMTVPEQAMDQEIASEELAQDLAYSDRPVAIEPGLALDIAPLSHMVARLTLMELLRGSETTLDSLYEDLVAPMYLYLNRREADTDYANLEPLEFNIDGMHVMRWYGVAIPRDPACPHCGDFCGEMGRQHGLTITEKDRQLFQHKAEE